MVGDQLRSASDEGDSVLQREIECIWRDFVESKKYFYIKSDGLIRRRSLTKHPRSPSFLKGFGDLLLN